MWHLCALLSGLYNRLMATSTTLSRKGTIVLHYRFQQIEVTHRG
jgi:hypothetical protein